MSPAVVLSKLTRRFGGQTVLDGIDLTTEPGQVVAIYGRSGSGKTTLLNLVGGLDRPTSGTVHICGEDLSAANLDELRRTQMAFIFQSYGLLPHLTARENVEFALHLAGATRSVWRERTESVLDAVGLTRRAQHRPMELSGGERQRVAIARALAVHPRLLLADEPTGALDHGTGAQMIDLLVAYAHSAQATVWIVTHDSAIRERVDVALRIVNGRLVAEGVPA